MPADDAAKWIIAVPEPAAALRFSGALMRAVWAEERDISDAASLAAIATEQGLDATWLVESAASAEVGSRYDALTTEALERQIFGAPTYVYRGMSSFRGQDRLDFWTGHWQNSGLWGSGTYPPVPCAGARRKARDKNDRRMIRSVAMIFATLRECSCRPH